MRKKKLFIGLAIGFVAAVGGVIGAVYAAVQYLPFQMGKLEETSQPTVVYDGNGHRYISIAAPGASSLPYKDIPKNLQNALVATEDHGYWTNSSFDLRGVLRSAYVDLRSGSLAQGGSTIEEQLAKIVYLNDKKTFTRKFQQILLGMKIERHFTKKQIITMYFNKVFFGDHAVGIEEAAQRYYNIDLRHSKKGLTLDQAAMLAGLPQAPSAYNPLLHPKAALQRRNEVLQNMAKYGYITKQQAAKAEKQPIQAKKDHAVPGDPWSQHPLFTNVLFTQAQKHGISEQALMQGGLKIYTTVDPKVQSAVHKVFWSKNYHGLWPGPTSGTVVEGGAVFLNPKTGGMLGAAGSRQQGFTRLGLDRVYSTSSPGSSIKPIMDYGPAIQTGNWGPLSILDDHPHNFGDGYYPRNWNANAPTRITLQYGLQWSQNVASVWLLQQIGLRTGESFAAKDGIPVSKANQNHLGVAIGGAMQVSPIQMAQAYEPFDNNGVQLKAHLITKVVNSKGQILYQYQPHDTNVMKQSTASKLTRLMLDVVDYGTGQLAKVPGWGVAGKTGTVQYNPGLSGKHPNWVRNGWFDGYTPTMVGAVYMGYDNSSSKYHLTMYPHDPSGNCAAIFGSIVKLATQGQQGQQFSVQPYPAWQGTANAANSIKTPVTGAKASYNAANNTVQLSWNSMFKNSVEYKVTRQGSPVANAFQNGSGGNSANQASSGGNKSAPQQVGITSSTSLTDKSTQQGYVYTYTIQAIDPTTKTNIGSPATAQVVTVVNGNGGNGAQSGNSGNSTQSGNGTGNSTGKSGGGTGNSSGNSTGNSTKSGSGTSNSTGNSTGNSTKSGGGTGSSTGNSTKSGGGGTGNSTGNSTQSGNGTTKGKKS
ncbi:transglycosylase domain-containing protein [Alicyclobacillus sp. SO9]|uniref:transglycosylase domain-containing protein n=1 Tax=Alicyclobacillus sp. SO9 TaxID=2665646 RepID=UPI0018E7DE44|nr:transglycosylase domain-containing protein [Alicyclobacillus sp. SO9]QQE79049.1 transglycosylase domain-containing protein [Alicyclobacillus sp. SO9]